MAIGVYLDASILVSLFIKDSLAERADAVLRSGDYRELVVSDFAAAEFASALGRRVRTRDLVADDVRAIFRDFDAWATEHSRFVTILAGDIAEAGAALRRLDLTLRTPDAVNIAIARRERGALATLDDRMATAATILGVAVARP